MKCITLSNVSIDKTHIGKLKVFLDAEQNLVVLPLLWSLHLAITGTVFGWKTQGTFHSSKNSFSKRPTSITRSFEISPISDSTIELYLGKVFHFLRYLNEIHQLEGTPSVHNTELVSVGIINHYLNVVLPKNIQSVETLITHQAAISAYINFLYALELKDFIPSSTIFRTTHQRVANNDNRAKKINYVARSERAAILQLCKRERDRLVIRMGFEVGLRTMENTGLSLHDFKAKNFLQPGLLTLFREMNNTPSKQSFEFTLNGKYTKRGKTRKVYFSRDLLASMQRYYENERASIATSSNTQCSTLFLRSDHSGLGLPISEDHGSNIFHELISKLEHINKSLSYHDLRHTFATELYHSELLDKEGRETRSESAALIVVAERLGHKSTSMSKNYIRLKQQMLAIEGI